ncbi:tetratricopeptide repeat protein [Fibrobacterota bacterium]
MKSLWKELLPVYGACLCLTVCAGRTSGAVSGPDRAVYRKSLQGKTAPDLTSEDISDSIRHYDRLIRETKKTSGYYGKLISSERDQLIKDIETMLRIFPLSQYNGEILLRLAELSYEQETEQFDALLDQRDRMLEEARARGDTSDVAFPAIAFDKTIAVYDRLLATPAYEKEHPVALYYKALCLIRTKREDEAVENLITITQKFQKSDYYTAALIKIGDYYFNRPYMKGGQGYNLAIESFKKAISNPFNPHFREAMYKLGWCYFQQDMYGEAISVFKSLVEKSNLDFSGTSGADLIRNPLLREEAIEFLAVSLDESGELEDALSFLKVIGNDNYASKVFLKLSNIYILRSDYTKSTRALNMLLDNYPLSVKAPVAKLTLVNNYQVLGRLEEAEMNLRDFFDSYSKGSEWYRNNRDREVRAYVDSQAIKILIKSTEDMLREARRANDRNMYIKVAKSYNRLLEEYPQRRESYEVEWNLAVIFEKYIKNYNAAYFNYMRVATQYPYTGHRKEALLSAISSVQKVWESGQASVPDDTTLSELAIDTSLTSVEKDIINGARKFMEFYGGDKEAVDIMLIEASVYFNRRLYSRAIPLYKQILSKKPRPKNYQEVMELLAQSYMGAQDFKQAEHWFGVLAGQAVNPNYIRAGAEGQMEAAYRGAGKLEKQGKFVQAAMEFASVAQRYPSARLADIAQFSSAEAYEKAGNYEKAALAYVELSKMFPQSKYADGALFNAATNYENVQQLKKAIETYEDLIKRFPNSPHIKNALFNISLNYEKLKDFEKVAEVNERFARMFPGEKDAPDMLFNTGKYYMKAELYDKALNVFRRFYTKYLGSDRELEARLYTGRCYLAMEDPLQAEENFRSAIARTSYLAGQGIPVNKFYASEAQMELAGIVSRKYHQIQLKLPVDALETSKKQKAELLKQAVAAYQLVIDYKNESAVKATHKIGGLYEDFAFRWKEQERPSDLNPARAAVVEKKILVAASNLLSNSLPFYQSNRSFGKTPASKKLPREIRSYIDSSSMKLKKLDLTRAEWQLQSAYVILNSPVPDKIKADPLTHFIYVNKLLETTSGDFEKSIQDFREFWVRGQGQRNNPFAREAGQIYARENYLLGARYAREAEKMLNFSFDNLEGLDEDAREEIQFQLEDMAFETQDVAIAKFKTALENARADRLKDIWSRQIKVALRGLDPEQHPRERNVRTRIIKSDPEWWANARSFPGWNTNPSDTATEHIFGPVTVSELSKPVRFPGREPRAMWTPQTTDSLYLRRTFALNGKVKSAIIDMTAEEDFILYVNGKEIYRDPDIPGDFTSMKSFDVKEELKQGTNLVAVFARSGAPNKGVLFQMEVGIDTAGEVEAEPVAAAPVPEPESPSFIFERRSDQELYRRYPNRQAFEKELIGYQKEARRKKREIRSEKNKLRSVREQLEDVTRNIKGLDRELKYYRKQLEDMKR